MNWLRELLTNPSLSAACYALLARKLIRLDGTEEAL